MKDYFKEGLEKIKVSYDEDKIEKSLKYLEILLDYNSHTNLTAIREEKAIIEKHFLDSLLLQNLLKEEAKKNKDFETADAIRSNLEKDGIILNDTREGTIWDFKALYNFN